MTGLPLDRILLQLSASVGVFDSPHQIPLTRVNSDCALTNTELLCQFEGCFGHHSTTVDLITFTLLLFKECCEFSVSTQ